MRSQTFADKSWFRIENRDDGATAVFLYDEVGKFGVTAAEFVRDLNEIKASNIDLRISSPGGEVFDGMAIYNAIRNHPAKVTVHIDGLAASAASFIAMAGDHIKAERTATLMIHDGMAVVAGNSKDLTAAVALLDKCSDNIASIYAERAGGTVADWRERMRAETWYTATEARDAGLVDEVVTGKARITNSAAWDLSLFRYAGREHAPAPIDMVCPAHDTAVSGGTWDAGAQMREMPSPMPVAMAKQMFAWIDAQRVQDGQMPKDAGKLPHHEMGEGMPANLNAVRNALARLDQTDIPTSDRDAVRAHLRAHLDAQPEAHIDPPDEAGFLMPDIRGPIQALAEIPFDVDLFRAAVELVAHAAPDDPPPPRPPMEPVAAPVEEPAEVVDPQAVPFDPDLLRAAVTVVVNDAPAPDQPPKPAPDTPEPELSINVPDLRRAIREGQL